MANTLDTLVLVYLRGEQEAVALRSIAAELSLLARTSPQTWGLDNPPATRAKFELQVEAALARLVTSGQVRQIGGPDELYQFTPPVAALDKQGALFR